MSPSIHPNGGSVEKVRFKNTVANEMQGRPGKPQDRKASSDSSFDAIKVLWWQDPAETILFASLLAGLAWAPFWLGSDRIIPWGLNGVVFCSLAVIYEVSILLRSKRHPVALRVIAVPASLFLLVIAWILVQMSTWVPPAIVHPIWNIASETLNRTLDGSVSVNRSATALALMRLLTDASVFWLTLQLCRDPLRAIILLRAILAIVVAYSAYGLVLVAAYKGEIPFFDTPNVGFVVRSTFVNRNTFATYAGMGLVIAVALILRLYRHKVPDHAELVTYRLTKFIEATGRDGWRLIGLTSIILVALLGSASRGGIIATVVGVVSVLILSTSRKPRRRGAQIEAIIIVALVILVGFVVFGDKIIGRIAVAGLEDTNRAAVYLIIIRAIVDVPFIGFGYGTFADIFPMYRDGSISPVGVFDLAHNSYLEVLLGVGLIVGPALIVSIGLLAYKAFSGALKRRRDATPAIVGTSVAFLVGVHAFVDYSLEIEAVALTFMALLGAGVAESISSRQSISD